MDDLLQIRTQITTKCEKIADLWINCHGCIHIHKCLLATIYTFWNTDYNLTNIHYIYVPKYSFVNLSNWKTIITIQINCTAIANPVPHYKSNYTIWTDFNISVSNVKYQFT